MAMQNCVNKLPTIGPTQPNFMFWADWRGGCNGTQMSIPEGDYNLLYGYDSLKKQFGSVIGYDDIDAIWMPPNTAGTAGSNGSDFSRSTTDRYDGSGGNTGYPGLYNNLDGRAIGNNDIDVLNIRVIKPWKQHLQECCTGNVDDQRKCGGYAKGMGVCDAQFAACSADDIKTYAMPNLQQQYCSAKIKANPQLSDSIKVQYCNANPTSPWCSCLTLEKDPEFQAWARAFGQKFPQLSVNKMAYVDKFGRNPCRSDTTDLSDIFLTQQIMADRNNLPNAVSIQDLTITGNNNVVNNEMDGGIGNTKPTPSAPAEAPPIVAGISNQNLMYLVILVIAVAIGYMVLGGDSDDSYDQMQQQYGNPYMNPMNPMGQMGQMPYQPMQPMNQMQPTNPMMNPGQMSPDQMNPISQSQMVQMQYGM